MSEAAEKAALDKIGFASEDDDPPQVPRVPDDDPPPDDEPPPAAKTDDDPPNYMNYDAWIADGRDPDDFKGKNAYSAEYDRIQLNNEKVDRLENSIQVIADNNEQWRQGQTKIIRDGLEADLIKAKEAADVDGAIDVTKKIADLDNTAPVVLEEPVVFKAFRKNNPMTDKDSSRFNEGYNRAIERYCNAELRELRKGGPTNDGDITACLNLAKKKAADLYPDLFTSSRNNRPSSGGKGGRKAGSGQSTDWASRLKGIGNSRNRHDGEAAVDMYNQLLEGGDKEAAEDYAKGVLGE